MTNPQLHRVHEFARLAGVTVKTLHHYDRLGLLRPARTRAGYRLYASTDSERLEQIAALKFIGLPLKQIKTLLDDKSPRANDALIAQRRALEEQRKQLDRAINAIDWELLEAERLKQSAGIERVPDRFNEARVSLYRDIAAALDAGAVHDVRSDRAQALVARWRAIIEDETEGDEAVRKGMMTVWAGRKTWPPSLKRYVASLYQMEPATWERVAGFIDRVRDARS
jgi:DNA-binding transcriptional MerR regulator